MTEQPTPDAAIITDPEPEQPDCAGAEDPDDLAEVETEDAEEDS